MGHRSVREEEPRWHAAVGAIFAIVLYVTLPPRLTFGPFWLMPVLVLILLVPLMVLKPRRHDEKTWQRTASIVHIALLNVFNIATVILLVGVLVKGKTFSHQDIHGPQILLAAVQIWLTNIIVFALWFWEIDGGGPDVRAHAAFAKVERSADFVFPQMAFMPDVQRRLSFRTTFWDYVFLAFTNASAFSPADTFPLTGLAKLLMMAEAAVSLVTLAVIAGRAINILA